ncbi:MAG: acyltransferase family protein [Holdemanella sp.]|nr:acyltransferase family protein [Holdemanella sp.]
MIEKKIYFKYIDVLRTILCIAVLFYHLGILPGGYLAVCSFFSLSGYLSCKSLMNNKKSLKDYYLSRLRKVYLPLVVVVLSTVGILSLIPGIIWVSLKPETTSVLLGYNNFWQISANMDYFARHTSSPFMHLWYIAILMQFELIFPIAFKLTNKFNNRKKSLIYGLLTVLCIFIFIFFNKFGSIMNVYYNTFSRVFSLLMGVSFACLHDIFKKKLIKNDNLYKGITYGLLIILVLFFIFVESGSSFFMLAMILTTLFTCIMIECAVNIQNNRTSNIFRYIKSISSSSYEIYLVQYPVLYLYQCIFGTDYLLLQVLLVSIVTLWISFPLHYALTNFKKLDSKKMLILIVCAAFSGLGCFKYIVARDNSEELKQLQEELTASSEKMAKQKEEYAKKQKEQEDAWAKLLAMEEPTMDEIKAKVRELPFVFVGDSVMLGAYSTLQANFPNAYIDAEVSRSGWKMAGILEGIDIKGPCVVHAGTNGGVSKEIFDGIMAATKGQDTYFLTVTNDMDMHVNTTIRAYCEMTDHAYLIDWEQLSAGQSEWFYADAIHLPPIGAQAYADIIFDAICQNEIAKFNKTKEEGIRAHEEATLKATTFYGDDLLIGMYDQLEANYSNANFISNNNLSYEDIRDSITLSIEEGTLTNRIVIVCRNLSDKQYQKLITLCKGHEVYIVSIKETKVENATWIDFYSEIKKNKDYISKDKVHLTDKGKEALSKKIIETIQ